MGNYIFPYEIIFVVTLKWLCENIYLQYCTFVWLASSMNSCCIPTCSFLEKHLLDKQGFKFYIISFRILVHVLRFFFFSFFLHLSTKYSPCVVVYLGSTKNVCKFTTSWRNEYFSSRMFFCERCVVSIFRTFFHSLDKYQRVPSSFLTLFNILFVVKAPECRENGGNWKIWICWEKKFLIHLAHKAKILSTIFQAVRYDLEMVSFGDKCKSKYIHQRVMVFIRK